LAGRSWFAAWHRAGAGGSARGRRQCNRIHLGTFTGPAGTFQQRTELAKPARDLLAKLSIDQPRKIHELTPAT
jgi:hypothetical protein